MFARLRNDGALPGVEYFRARLAEVARAFGVHRIAGALLQGGDIHYAHSAFEPDTPQPVVCIAKVATASLIARLVAAGRIDLHQKIATFFGGFADADGFAQDVTLFHLLGHTHGWEGACPVAICRDGRGFIAAEAILQWLTRRPRLHAPGAAYSYDAAGYLLLGAALERIHGARFPDILTRHLLTPLGVAVDDVADACPADGGGLALSVRALSLLLAHHLTADDMRLLHTPVKIAPGWSPFYKGTTLGWRDLGDGWLGHEGVGLNGAPYSTARLNPERHIGLVVMSPDARARLAATRLFLDFSPAAPHTMLASPERSTPVQRDAYGLYDNGRSQVRIFESAPGALCARWSLAHGYGAPVDEARMLHRAPGNVFLTATPIGRRCFFQPVALTPGGVLTHLWDGYELYRRVGV